MFYTVTFIYTCWSKSVIEWSLTAIGSIEWHEISTVGPRNIFPESLGALSLNFATLGPLYIFHNGTKITVLDYVSKKRGQIPYFGRYIRFLAFSRDYFIQISQFLCRNLVSTNTLCMSIDNPVYAVH